MFLCKQPWSDSHVCVHLSSIFCKVSPFFLASPIPWLDFLTCFLTLTFLAFFTVQKLILTPFINVLTHLSLLSHFPCELQTWIFVILKLSLLSKHSLRSWNLLHRSITKSLTYDPLWMWILHINRGTSFTLLDCRIQYLPWPDLTLQYVPITLLILGGIVSRRHASKRNSQRCLNWFTTLQLY